MTVILEGARVGWSSFKDWICMARIMVHHLGWIKEYLAASPGTILRRKSRLVENADPSMPEPGRAPPRCRPRCGIGGPGTA